MKKDTIAVQAGRNPRKNLGSVSTPIHRTSTVLFPTLEAYEEAQNGKDFYEVLDGVKSADLSYGVGGTPTTFELQKAVAAIEGTGYSLVLPSGLAAITLTLMSFLKEGDHLLMVDTVYGPTRRFCNKELKKFGIETTYYDPMIGSDIIHLIKENTKIVFTESPGSLTFEVQDIPAISEAAKSVSEEIIIVIDNSWASPIYFNSFEHGADVSILAGTKYIGGHSDIFLGTVTAREKHFTKLVKTYKNFGFHTSPEDCYLGARGIRTMPTRIKVHEKAALDVAKWLKKRKEVTKILHPAFPSCPGYKTWKRDFTGSTGLFSIVLDKKYSFEAMCAMFSDFKVFGIGASWGGFESLAIYFEPESIRTATSWTEKNSCVRLYIGLENIDDIKEDLDRAFKRLAKFK